MTPANLGDGARAVLFENIHPNAAAALEKAGYQVTSHERAFAGDELLERAAGAHLLGIRSMTRLTAPVLEALPDLWAVGCFCIGTNQVDIEVAAARGVPVFNAPFSSTRSVAELTVAEVIALHRRLFERSDEMHRGIWNKTGRGAHEVRGRTLGIVGYGRIGSQVSVLAESMGMRVLFHDIVDVLPMGNASSAGSLEALLERSDVVTLHVPATDQTRGMVGAAELACMRPGAFLINNARGSVVDIDALVVALREKRLGGAALDVFPTEPSSGKEPFHNAVRGLPNVILTPHVGGSTLEAQAAIADTVAQRLVTLVGNGSTTTAVNVPEVQLPRLHTADHRVLHFHANVPGVLGRINTIIAGLGLNISAEYLQSNPKYGYAILDIEDPPDRARIERELGAVPGTIRVRTIW